jgi:hypothetical protein
MHLDWNIHYFRWVIDDGEPELHVGDVFDWGAVSFWSDAPLIRSPESTRSAAPIVDGRYRVSAEIIYVSQDPKQAACIIDFGIRAISDGLGILPHGCMEGDYVVGEVQLELPLCTAVHIHNLAHQWRVNRISADLTPYVPDSSDREFRRDTTQVLYRDVIGTDSVKASSYLLHCSDLNA